GLSTIQADEILKLQLQRLTGLERRKIVEELEALRVRITELRALLASQKLIDGVVADELKQIRDDHSNPRRTEIQDAVDELTVEDMIAEEDVAISLTHTGYVKRTSITTYRSQRRGGRGRIGMKTKDEDFVDNLFIASPPSTLLVSTAA